MTVQVDGNCLQSLLEMVGNLQSEIDQMEEKIEKEYREDIQCLKKLLENKEQKIRYLQRCISNEKRENICLKIAELYSFSLD